MILLAIGLALGMRAQVAISFPANPSEGQCWRFSTRSTYCYLQGHWQIRAQTPLPPGKPLPCPQGTHFHPKNMPTNVPDVRGGPPPKADGLCHLDDRSDAVAAGQQPKLEASR